MYTYMCIRVCLSILPPPFPLPFPPPPSFSLTPTHSISFARSLLHLFSLSLHMIHTNNYERARTHKQLRACTHTQTITSVHAHTNNYERARTHKQLRACTHTQTHMKQVYINKCQHSNMCFFSLQSPLLSLSKALFVKPHRQTVSRPCLLLQRLLGQRLVQQHLAR